MEHVYGGIVLWIFFGMNFSPRGGVGRCCWSVLVGVVESEASLIQQFSPWNTKSKVGRFTVIARTKQHESIVF